MIKLVLTTAAMAVAMTASAYAGNASWNVTEQSMSGIKSTQGTWMVATDANNKVTGSATLQFNNGDTLTYKLDGEVANSVYTINLVDRSDGKKKCVWSGKAMDAAGHVMAGEAVCDGGKFYIKAGF